MYQIKNINQLDPFLMTLTSAYDHWMYISSTGCLTAGRSEAQHSIFPYVTDDLLHKNHHFTGPVTLIKATLNGKIITWEPFSKDNRSNKFQTNLYKGPLGNQIIFEEIFSYIVSSTNKVRRITFKKEFRKYYIEFFIITSLSKSNYFN